MRDYKYYAFISYKREDEAWAKWLQNKLEYFKLPISSNDEEYIRPIFRDITDLRPGCLPELIREALDNSKYLIAICSPRYSKSKWCDEEIRYFKDTGRIRNVIPFIIDGKPYSEDDECFPPTLSELRGTENELLGADVRTLTNEYALVQTVATMFGVEVDSIWKMYLKDEEKKKRKLKQQNDYLLSLQSRITAAKTEELINTWPYDEKTAGKLILEILPKDISLPDRPWVREAEYILRRVMHKSMHLREVVLPPNTFVIDYGETYIATVKSHRETVMNPETGHLTTQDLIPDYSIGIFQNTKDTVIYLYGLPYHSYGVVMKAALSPDNKYLAFISNEKLMLLNIESKVIKECAKNIFSEPQRATLKWSPEKRWVVCNDRYRIVLFDVRDDKEFAIDAHTKNVISLAFDASGRYLVSVGFDRVVIIWDLQDGCQEVFRYECPDFVSFASYDDQSKELLLAISTCSEKQGSTIDNVNQTGRNIIRRLNVETDYRKDLVLRDLSNLYIMSGSQLKDLELLVIEDMSKISVFDINTGVKVDEYQDAHKLKVYAESNLIKYVNRGKVEEYKIPTLDQLLLEAKHEFTSIELSEDIKYEYFIK